MRLPTISNCMQLKYSKILAKVNFLLTVKSSINIKEWQSYNITLLSIKHNVMIVNNINLEAQVFNTTEMSLSTF